MNKQEVDLLREELEILMAERSSLLNVAGAAAVLVANTHAEELPAEAAQAANLLSRFVNALPEETLKDALDAVHVLRLSSR
jgi:hypothetical protein